VRFVGLASVSVVATGTATALMLFLARGLPATSVVLTGGLSPSLARQPACVWTKPSWAFGSWPLLLTSLSVTLVVAGRPKPQTPAHGLTLAMLGCGLPPLCRHIVTLRCGWGMLDALFCATLVTQGGSTSGRRAQLALGINGLATVGDVGCRHF